MHKQWFFVPAIHLWKICQICEKFICGTFICGKVWVSKIHLHKVCGSFICGKVCVSKIHLHKVHLWKIGECKVCLWKICICKVCQFCEKFILACRCNDGKKNLIKLYMVCAMTNVPYACAVKNYLQYYRNLLMMIAPPLNIDW